MTIQLQNSDPLQLQDGTNLDRQGGGQPVQPPVTKIEPGDLGASTYPSFFPCATWEYGQNISGNFTPTSFDSGWTRYRKRWRENVSSVNLTFNMNTNMFDRFTAWMVANGYDWFTMPLDRFGGQQVISEVRLISPLQWDYDAFDSVTVRATGELGSPGYGPQDGPLEGDNDFGNFCVGVYVTNQWRDFEEATAGATIDFNVVVGDDNTQPIEYAWYEDSVLLPGETGATFSYVVPVPDNPVEGQSYNIAANVTNPCGSQWLRATVTVPPDNACEPYSCSALIDEMAGVEGAGVWDLLDGNDEPVIPALWEQRGQYLPGIGLTCTDSGGNWDSSTGVSRTTLNVNDADICEGPYVASNGWNSAGSPSAFFLTPQPQWGAALPNASVAAVVRGVRAHTTTPENHFWRGTTALRTYTQTGSTTNLGFQQDIRIGTDIVDSVEYDAVWFNYQEVPSERRWAFLMPFGFFTDDVPKLLEAGITVDDIQFPASSNQSFSRARYDVIVTCTYFVSVTDSATGLTYSDTHSVEFLLTRTFETHDNPALPLSEARKPFFDGNGTPACQYLQGGWGAVYNLAAKHGHGGEEVGTPIRGGQNPGRIGSNLALNFRRNYTDYETPEYCNGPP